MASTTSRLTQLEELDQILVIPMNDCGQLILGPNPLKWIGTRDLNSCHAVVIRSPICILLAHISPRPDLNRTTHDPNAPAQHVHAQMQRFMQLYRQFQRYFYEEKISSGICAVYQGTVTLPDQVNIIDEYLNAAELPVQHYSYRVPTGAESPLARGTVVVGWEDECNTCDMYVEDSLRARMNVPQKYRDRLAATTRPSQSIVTSSSRQLAGPSSSGSTSATTPTDLAQDMRDVSNAALAILNKSGMDNPQSFGALGASARAVRQASRYEDSSFPFALEVATHAVAEATGSSHDRAQTAVLQVHNRIKQARIQPQQQHQRADESEDEDNEDEDDEDDEDDEESNDED